LLFLIFINDIVIDIRSSINLFADDTSLYVEVQDPNIAANQLQADIDKISSWAAKWLVTFNPSKSESLVVSRKRNRPVHPTLSMLGQNIPEVTVHKHLGVNISEDASWHIHIESIVEKAWKKVHILRRLKFLLDWKSLDVIYITFIRPGLEYADILWSNITKYDSDKLDKIQNECARIVTGATRLVSLERLAIESNWESLSDRRYKHRMTHFYKMYHNLVPDYLSSLIPRQEILDITSETNMMSLGSTV
jgi:hypothetical protein